MKRTKGHDTGLLVIPKTVLLEAVRGTGHREHIAEVYLPDVDHPNKEILPYTCFLVKYGLSLDPGHKQTIEVNSRPLGFPKPTGETEDGEVESREQGRSFKRPNCGSKDIPHLPVFGKRGQGARDGLKRKRKPRNPELAKALGISRMSVYQKLYRLGIKAVRGRRGPQPRRGGGR